MLLHPHPARPIQPQHLPIVAAHDLEMTSPTTMAGVVPVAVVTVMMSMSISTMMVMMTAAAVMMTMTMTPLSVFGREGPEHEVLPPLPSGRLVALQDPPAPDGLAVLDCVLAGPGLMLRVHVNLHSAQCSGSLHTFLLVQGTLVNI